MNKKLIQFCTCKVFQEEKLKTLLQGIKFKSRIWTNGPGPKHLKLRGEFGGLDRVSGPERNMVSNVKGVEGASRQKWWERLAQKACCHEKVAKWAVMW